MLPTLYRRCPESGYLRTQVEFVLCKVLESSNSPVNALQDPCVTPIYDWPRRAANIGMRAQDCVLMYKGYHEIIDMVSPCVLSIAPPSSRRIASGWLEPGQDGMRGVAHPRCIPRYTVCLVQRIRAGALPNEDSPRQFTIFPAPPTTTFALTSLIG